tara:strand:- start:609 stop:728 length:120 start_codon:yes stop_codon:yes gene_type:complete
MGSEPNKNPGVIDKYLHLVGFHAYLITGEDILDGFKFYI